MRVVTYAPHGAVREAGMSNHTMSDFEIALMDALKTVFEVLVAKEITPAEVIAGMLRRQRAAQRSPMVSSGKSQASSIDVVR
jgi:hypothetical protein